MNACEKIGMPEVRIILAHATIYSAIFLNQIPYMKQWMAH